MGILDRLANARRLSTPRELRVHRTYTVCILHDQNAECRTIVIKLNYGLIKCPITKNTLQVRPEYGYSSYDCSPIYANPICPRMRPVYSNTVSSSLLSTAANAVRMLFIETKQKNVLFSNFEELV